MTTEAQTQTFESYLEPDYTEILEEIRSQEVEQTELLNTYLPEIYKVSVLVLGSFLALTVFRLLTSFLGRVFNDNSKF